MSDEQEMPEEITQSESKLNYAGTRDHPGSGYVDNDPPSLFDKRERRARRLTKATRFAFRRYMSTWRI